MNESGLMLCYRREGGREGRKVCMEGVRMLLGRGPRKGKERKEMA